MRRRALERSLPGAALAHSIDDVRLLVAHRREHGRKKLRRILEVGVDNQYRLAPAQVETGGERELMPMVARQVDRDQVGIGRRHPLHRRPARVARAVVDQHQLIILAYRNLGGGAQPLVKLDEAGFLVEAWDDDRKRCHGRV